MFDNDQTMKTVERFRLMTDISSRKIILAHQNRRLPVAFAIVIPDSIKQLEDFMSSI